MDEVRVPRPSLRPLTEPGGQVRRGGSTRPDERPGRFVPRRWELEPDAQPRPKTARAPGEAELGEADFRSERAPQQHGSAGEGRMAATRPLTHVIWVVVIGLLIGAAVGLVISLTTAEKYGATATVTSGSLAPDASNEADLAVAARAADTLKDKTTAADVSNAVALRSRQHGSVVDVEATAKSARQSARIANAYARAFVATLRGEDRAQLNSGIRRLRQRFAHLSVRDQVGPTGHRLRSLITEFGAARALQANSTKLIQGGIPPTKPEKRHLIRNITLGGLLGAMLAFALGKLRPGQPSRRAPARRTSGLSI